MTAAYASGRSNAMTALAGVAIAAALVPPFAVVGIALTHGSPLISGNAVILLITNLVAIIRGAAIVFRMFKIHISHHGVGMPTWVHRATMLLFLSLALLIAPLMIHMIEGRRMGQNRPLEYPEECLVIGRWISLEHWQQWKKDERRIDLNEVIEKHLRSRADYSIYDIGL